MPYYDEAEALCSYLSRRKQIAAINGKHVPNKNEAKELRQYKTYRKKLADARIKGTQGTTRCKVLTTM